MRQQAKGMTLGPQRVPERTVTTEDTEDTEDTALSKDGAV
jgi:hypothetical protein